MLRILASRWTEAAWAAVIVAAACLRSLALLIVAGVWMLAIIAAILVVRIRRTRMAKREACGTCPAERSEKDERNKAQE